MEVIRSFAEFAANDNVKINLFGRYSEDEKTGGLHFANSGSGFEVRFFGTYLKMKALAYKKWNEKLSVFVDGKTDSEENIITVSNSENEHPYTVIKGLEEKEHTVKVLSRCASVSVTYTVNAISTDGYFMPAPERKKLKLEFFGDSITCGSGILRKVEYQPETGKYYDENVYSENTQDALLSYAFVASGVLDAEPRIYGRGGIGIYYSPSVGSDISILGNPYSVDVDLHIPYDYSSYTPDVVVIYLGTNDQYFGKKFNTDYSLPALAEKFREFIRNVIGKHYGKNIPIFICSGLMVPEAHLEICMNEVKETLSDEFPNIETVEFTPCKAGHPVVWENRAAGELLAAKISEKLGKLGKI